MSKALDDVAAERERQVLDERWTPEHDDKHKAGCMAVAGACYALLAVSSHNSEVNDHWRGRYAASANQLWPWGDEWWKPCAPRRMLVTAAALLLAEIERQDRAAGYAGKG